MDEGGGGGGFGRDVHYSDPHQVSRNFTEVFEELVPGGAGRLEMKMRDSIFQPVCTVYMHSACLYRHFVYIHIAHSVYL